MRIWRRVVEWVRRWRSLPARCAAAERQLELRHQVNLRLRRAVEELHSREGAALSLAQAERVALLLESCGAVSVAAAKVLRFGWEGESPWSGRPNRNLMERELGNLRAAVQLLADAGDVRWGEMRGQAAYRANRMGENTVHQAARLRVEPEPEAGGAAR